MASILFGPVNSRRFGKSLGIDLSPYKKQCNFDCLYCELEPAKTMDHYEDVISVDEIIEALQKGIKEHPDIDVITLTANGEPTLYPYLGELIDRINQIKGEKQTLILSNGSTIADPSVQNALLKLDRVKLSLDCGTDTCLKRLDRAHKGITIGEIMSGMLEFRSKYDKPLIIEILIVRTLNDKPEEISKLNEFLLKLRPTRIDMGTIDRPPAYDVKPVSYEELLAISHQFDASLPLYIVSRHKSAVRASSYSDEEIVHTLANRPLTLEDIESLFDEASKKRFEILLKDGKLKMIQSNGVEFYKKA
ncbi:MAG: radical SAM protein [Campylobacterales bacterium]|nr:radical SAM protein [Campylobacterales bacterium]